MALIDNALVLSTSTALTGSAIVGSAINFGHSDIGTGKSLELVILCTVTGTGATVSNSFQYALRTAETTAGLAAGEIVLISELIPGTSHVAGEVVFRGRLPAAEILSRVALYAVEAGTATATVQAFIVGEAWQRPMGSRLPISAAS